MKTIDGVSHPVSDSCAGEKGCAVKGCDGIVTHKLGEEIPQDEPCHSCGKPFDSSADDDGEVRANCGLGLGHGCRHNLTAYVCCGHYKMIVGDAAPCGETEFDRATATYDIINSMAEMLYATADQSKAKNYVSVQLVGMDLPFDRVNIELMRPGGLTPAQKVGELKSGMRTAANSLLRALTVMDDDRELAVSKIKAVAVALNNQGDE